MISVGDTYRDVVNSRLLIIGRQFYVHKDTALASFTDYKYAFVLYKEDCNVAFTTTRENIEESINVDLVPINVPKAKIAYWYLNLVQKEKL